MILPVVESCYFCLLAHRSLRLRLRSLWTMTVRLGRTVPWRARCSLAVARGVLFGDRTTPWDSMAPKVTSKLTPNQAAFLEWLVTPSELREPSTQTELAKKLGVATTTLTAWKKDTTFRTHWDARLTELQVDPERIDQVMQALYKRATDGSEKAIGMYLEVANRYRPQVNVHVEDARQGVDQLSDEQLAALLAAHASDELAARRAG